MIELLVSGQTYQVEPGRSIAESCGANGIAIAAGRRAVAARINGHIVDLSKKLDADTELELIAPEQDEGLELIRHSCAHVMAEAVLAHFPAAKPTIGPVVGDRFYYDFDTSEEARPISSEDFARIEKTMAEIIAADRPFVRRELSVEQAKAEMAGQGNPYKVENIEAAAANGGTVISFYKQGDGADDFEDLCRGPHVPSTRRIGSFKLLSVAGTTWRGAADGQPLQRLYGTAWSDRKQLKEYLRRIEEAKKRDHRKLGSELGLFHIEHDIAPGQIFFHDAGMKVLIQLRAFIRDVLRENGYSEVQTPLLLDRKLWETSGHWEKFRERMIVFELDGREVCLKPMNCPGHCLIYKTGVRSYRELPLRMAEFGHVHRNESRGELLGTLRVRGMIQDDAHIFCTPDQLAGEISNCMDQCRTIYSAFGFDSIRVELSTRPDDFIGEPAAWDRAEAELKEVLDAAGTGMEYKINPGDGAFYGPKIDFHTTDSIGRSWQMGTVQVDFNLPERFGLEYVDSDNRRKRPVMIHRALCGSLERFFGILVEEYAGAFPVWLAPVQVKVASIADRHSARVEEIVAALKASGLRAEADTRQETIGAKKRDWRAARIPYFGVIGDRELTGGQVAVSGRGNVNVGAMDVDALVERIQQDVASKALSINPGSG